MGSAKDCSLVEQFDNTFYHVNIHLFRNLNRILVYALETKPNIIVQEPKILWANDIMFRMHSLASHNI